MNPPSDNDGDDDIMKTLDELEPLEPAAAPAPAAAPKATPAATPAAAPPKKKRGRPRKSPADAARPKTKRQRRVAKKPAPAPAGEIEAAASVAVAAASVCIQPDAGQADAPARLDLAAQKPAPAPAPAAKKRKAKAGAKGAKPPRAPAAPPPAAASGTPPSAPVPSDVVTSLAQGPAGGQRARMSASVEAMRNTARKGMPAAARERLLVGESTSFLTTDPTRDEERATLASMASGRGVPLSEGGATGAPPKKKRASEPAVHRLEDLPPAADWGPHTPSEREAEEDLALPRVREASKHPGKIKTAGLGVAVPPPGRHHARLRKELDRSSLSQHRAPQEGPADAPLDGGRWEREGPADVARALDARRMTGGDGEAVRPLAELRTAFSDHHRLTLADARTSLSRYLGGLVEQKCLEIDAAARLLRAAGAPPSEGAEARAAASSAAPRPSAAKRARRGASRNLILDASEREILEVMCAPAALAPPAPPSDVPLLPPKRAGEGRGRFADALLKALPSSGFYRATKMPLDEIEVAVLSGASLRDAMSYFMSFDDSVAAMEAVYESARRMVAVTTSVDTLRQAYGRANGRLGPTLAETPLPRRKEILEALARHEAQLDREWQELGGGGDSKKDGEGAEARELWVRRNAARVLRAVLTGDLEGQRHSLMRTIVAREESLLGLYREPAQRCFLSGERGEEGEEGGEKGGVGAAMERGEADRDAVSIMRRILALEPPSSSPSGSPEREAVPLLPDLGTPATKAYCADFLRAPDPQRPLERPCANGERACQAWILAAHSAWPATGGLNRATHAFVAREFFPPDRWQRIQQEGSLPEERGVCLLCARMTATYYWVQMRLLDVRGTVGLRDEARRERWRGTLLGQSHCNAIEPESGYTEADILPVCRPSDGPWTGILQPIVAFRANSYVPGVCTAPIDLQRRDPAADATVADAAAAADGAPAKLPCFYERTAADFH